MEKIDVVQGYRIPGGRGGLAVRLSCKIIASETGIKQKNLLSKVVALSNLNESTSSWIVTPKSVGSPAEILWTRAKIGNSFCLFPNDHTRKVAETYEDELINLVSKKSRAAGRKFLASSGQIVPGDIGYLRNGFNELGLFRGYAIVKHYYSFDLSSVSIFNTVEEALSDWTRKVKEKTAQEYAEIVGMYYSSSGKFTSCILDGAAPYFTPAR